jgi:hypothetical protein
MRGALAAALAALAVAALPQVAAGLLVWTFVVLPLTATAGQGTAFTMTATNVAGPDDLGCLEVTLPASFAIGSVSDPVASNGDNWVATQSGTTVEVRSLSGGGRLNIGESVTFQVTATPSSAGVTSWPNHAHRQQDCSGLTEVGLPVQVVVLPPLLATPTPTPKPTPRPTARPTVRPSPVPSLPISLPPLPSLAPSVSATPTASSATSERTQPSSSATASSAPAAIPLPGGAVATPSPGPGAAGGPPSSQAPRVAPDPGEISVGAGTLTVLDGIGTWSVPAAVVGVPGLLVVLWVALQTVGTLAWIPAVRRLRGDRGARRKRDAH